MKKLLFVIFILILVLFAGVGYALHFNSIGPFWRFVENEVRQISPTPKESFNKPKSTDIPEKDEAKGLTLSFAGDVLLDGNVASLIKSKGKEYVISDVKPVLSSSDISMVNLENPVSSRGTKAPNKQYTFRVNPNNIDILTSAGIDIVTLANNHSLDYGRDALMDTFSNLDRIAVRYVGAGADIDRASKAVNIEKNGYNTAFLGSSHVIPEVSWGAGKNTSGVATTYNPSRLISEIESARKTSDIVVVYIHWGEEKKNTPLSYQRNLAKMYIDSGADIVIGSHPHVLQGVEFYKGRLIAYSLGNFIFTDLKKDTMILNIKYTGNSYKASITPCTIDKYRPVQIRDKSIQKSFFKNLESMSYNVRINENGDIIPLN